jgi:hypothetical protein
VIINLFAAVKPAAPVAPVILIVLDVTVPCAAISLNSCTNAAVDKFVYDTLICGEVPVHCPADVLSNLTACTLLINPDDVLFTPNTLRGHENEIDGILINALLPPLTNGVAPNDPTLLKLINEFKLEDWANAETKVLTFII